MKNYNIICSLLMNAFHFLQIYFQIGKKMRMKAMVDLFNGIIKEMIFSQLRNKEQLGYIVDCSPHLMSGVNGFSIYVISANRDPIYLLKQVRRFVYTIKDRLVSSYQKKKKLFVVIFVAFDIISLVVVAILIGRCS